MISLQRDVETLLCNGDEMMCKVYSTTGANYLLPNILWQVVQHSSVVLGISIPGSDFTADSLAEPRKRKYIFFYWRLGPGSL